MARVPILAAIANLLSLVLTLVLVLSGITNHVVVDFLKIHTSQIKDPSVALEGSAFLRDLANISSSGAVNDDQGHNLELADSYSLTLITICAHRGETTSEEKTTGVSWHGGNTLCGKPSLDFKYNPDGESWLDVDDGSLNVDSEDGFTTGSRSDNDEGDEKSSSAVSVTGPFSSAYSTELAQYRNLSWFLGLGFVFSALTAVLALVCMLVFAPLLSTRHYGAGVTAALIFQILATALGLAASVASLVIFIKLGDALNQSLGLNADGQGLGIRASLGAAAYAMGFLAASLSAASTSLLFAFRRKARRQQMLKEHHAMRARPSGTAPGMVEMGNVPRGGYPATGSGPSGMSGFPNIMVNVVPGGLVRRVSTWANRAGVGSQQHPHRQVPMTGADGHQGDDRDWLIGVPHHEQHDEPFSDRLSHGQRQH